MYNKAIFQRCFSYKGRYWYKNIKYIPLYFKLMHHLVKYGYDEYATWETFDWFISTMRSILTTYKNTHHGYPCTSEDSDEQAASEKEFDNTLDKMISLLDDMDEGNPKYHEDEYAKDMFKQDKEMNAAKDEFFKLFAKHFYSLWD